MSADAASPAPTAALISVTPEARAALCGKREQRIATFPFKVGREDRLLMNPPNGQMSELRLRTATELNDLYLFEPPYAQRRHISREHFLIEYDGTSFVIVDRGSVCGTIVGSRIVGGDRAGGRAILQHGQHITVGNQSSPYKFRFVVLS